MRREMMEFANHPALHFSLTLVLDSPNSRLNLHLPIPAPLICKPYAPFFPGAWLKGAVHFTLARTFLLTPAGFNKKFKSRRPAASTRQSSISVLKPATYVSVYNSQQKGAHNEFLHYAHVCEDLEMVQNGEINNWYEKIIGNFASSEINIPSLILIKLDQLIKLYETNYYYLKIISIKYR